MTSDLGRAVSRMANPDRMRRAAQAAVQLARPALDPEGSNLVYILSQSARMGHFGMETQILRTLYEDRYDRIVVVAGALDTPGTNPCIPACAGPKMRFVHTADLEILLLGQIDAGLQRAPGLDLLLAGPRAMITAFYRHILDGGAPVQLELAPEVETRARAALECRGIEPERPFVFFHNRTLGYLPGMAYHHHRTADVSSYRDSIARLVEAGYRVIRIGEPGLDDMGFPASDYVNVPDWPDRDPAVDLFVCARCAFGLAQNSGPIWVAAAFGRQVLRTNLPFELLNMPYNDDLSAFKRYRRTGSDEPLRYREILDLGLPALSRAEDIAAAGCELLPNTPAELLAATEEMLERQAGRWHADEASQQKFRALGAEYERRLAAGDAGSGRDEAFYGYAQPYGMLARSYLAANPGFLD